MTSIIVQLPLPPRVLSPNARPHYMTKARAVKRTRQSTCMIARAATESRPLWKRATIQLAYTFARKGRRDPDNLIAWAKANIDGLRDAGILADDDAVAYLPPQVAVGKPESLTITVERTANA